MVSFYTPMEIRKFVVNERFLGPIIRVTPDEVHINDVGFLDTIYAPSTTHRDKYEYQLRALRVPGGVGTTPSYNVHKKRREALSPWFSKRNVTYFEPVIKEKVQQLCDKISKHEKDRTPANLSDLLFGFSSEYVSCQLEFVDGNSDRKQYRE
jgi:hypothetical protein